MSAIKNADITGAKDMSAGAFTVVGYEADYADGTAIHPIKVQTETLALTINSVQNTAAASAINNPISAQVGKGRRTQGLHARIVSLVFTGTPPATYLAGQTLRVPLVNKDMKNVCTTGATGTYLGVAVRVISNYTPEVVR